MIATATAATRAGPLYELLHPSAMTSASSSTDAQTAKAMPYGSAASGAASQESTGGLRKGWVNWLGTSSLCVDLTRVWS